MRKGIEAADFDAFKAGRSKPSETQRTIMALTFALSNGLAEMDERLRKLEAKQ